MARVTPRFPTDKSCFRPVPRRPYSPAPPRRRVPATSSKSGSILGKEIFKAYRRIRYGILLKRRTAVSIHKVFMNDISFRSRRKPASSLPACFLFLAPSTPSFARRPSRFLAFLSNKRILRAPQFFHGGGKSLLRHKGRDCENVCFAFRRLPP